MAARRRTARGAEGAAEAPRGLKIGEVARRSGVPVGTIKFYLREGLIPRPVEAGRNMARYDAGVVERIRIVKELQEKRFLPLKVIRAMMGAGTPDAEAAADATREALSAAAELALAGAGVEPQAIDALAAEALTPEERRTLERAGVLGGAEQEPAAAAIDARILRSLVGLRRAGFTRRRGFGADRLVFYAEAVRALVTDELERVVGDVVGRLPPDEAPEMLSRALVLIGDVIVELRQKALLGMIAGLAVAMPPASAAGPRGGRPRG